MKGGFYGLKISQVSLILIVFVCATVLTLAWTKTPFLTSLIPAQNHFLWVFSDEESAVKQVLGGNSSVHSERIVDPVAKINSNITSSFTGTKGKENSTIHIDKIQEIPPSVKDGSSPSETSQAESSSKQLENNLVSPTSTVSTSSSDKIKQNENVTTPTERQGSTNSSDSKEQNENVIAPTERQDCNYAKGKWIMDPKRPLYSGFGCKQWLSAMWACRLTQRTDFEYEFLRWQPKDCKMEEFTSSKFLSRMVNKTLAFIGDSLGRQQFQSMMCMITGGEERPDVLDVGKEYGLVKSRGAVRPDGWAYRFPSTNTTILYYWSASLCDLEPINASNPLTDIAMHLDRPPAFLRRYIHKFDVIVLNTGHHWNRGKLKANRWVMYVGGVPNTNRKIAGIAGARNFTVYSIINWMNSQLPNYPGLKVFYRSMSPRHFFNGDWNTGGTCDNTTPLSTGKEVLKEESSDPLAAGAVRGTGVKLLDITALSEIRDEGHISRYSIKATPGVQDCLHWCLPGVPDTWNEILFAQI